MLKLSFGIGRKNAKLKKLEKKTGKRVYTFSILSGHTCPYAKECHSKSIDGKIVDGPHTRFRCFSASQENFLPNILASRQANTAIVKLAAVSVSEATDCILANLPDQAGIIRIHVGGDFATQAYFDAWLGVAAARPDIVFYAYTKSLPFWIKRLGSIPKNMRLTASRGGHKDNLINQYGLRSARVVFSREEARGLGLKIDTDDSSAVSTSKRSFALLLHGTQPKGSEAARVWDKLRRSGQGYKGLVVGKK